MEVFMERKWLVLVRGGSLVWPLRRRGMTYWDDTWERALASSKGISLMTRLIPGFFVYRFQYSVSDCGQLLLRRANPLSRCSEMLLVQIPSLWRWECIYWWKPEIFTRSCSHINEWYPCTRCRHLENTDGIIVAPKLTINLLTWELLSNVGAYTDDHRKVSSLRNRKLRCQREDNAIWIQWDSSCFGDAKIGLKILHRGWWWWCR